MELSKQYAVIRKYIFESYKGMFREAGGAFEYPFLTPGSEQYADVLWDWDSWLSNVALRQILIEAGNKDEIDRILPYERGCVLNYLNWGGMDGWIPITIVRDVEDTKGERPKDIYRSNMHKPVLAQHAAFLVRLGDGDAEWLRKKFYFMQTFLNNYKMHHRHKCGLYYWQDDHAIGVDNDPCTYFRPIASSGSIYLNCLMYKELQAMAYLCDCLNLNEISNNYRKDAYELKQAIQGNCWDEWTGFFYSVDLNLISNEDIKGLHRGYPRDWDCLIQRIGVWSGFLALWAGIATPEQAKRIVEEHYRNQKTYNAPAGVRTLSKMEKMYKVHATGNPSDWLGPVWGVSNYMTFRGLIKYGFLDDARELAEKTIRLFAKDFDRFGALHEYYQPENGEPILNRGFQNWNFLVLNMIAWMEDKDYIEEF
jgi:putative isomerase